MELEATSIKDAYVIRIKKYNDKRGFFSEIWNQKIFDQKLSKNIKFVQENLSSSKKNVLRGLHYQIKNSQGKLVRVSNGSIYDVIVDLRQSSPSFKKWFGIKLSYSNNKLLWAPPGCAHGFHVLSKTANVVYKTTDFWFPEHERCILWNDPDLKINWNITNPPILSIKDSKGKKFKDLEYFA